MSSPDFSACCLSAQIMTNPIHELSGWAALSLEELGRKPGSVPSMALNAGGKCW